MTQRKTKTAEQRTFFAPLPTRAIADPRLSALHFRVLACIAYHDRMANRRKTGGGCWASHKTLCDEIGCNYTNFSTAITQLGEFGYLTRRVHPLNKKLRIYNVIYEDGLPTGKLSKSDADGLPMGKPQRQIVCPPESQTLTAKMNLRLIYSVKRGIEYVETWKETHLKVRRLASAQFCRSSKGEFDKGSAPPKKSSAASISARQFSTAMSMDPATPNGSAPAGCLKSGDHEHRRPPNFCFAIETPTRCRSDPFVAASVENSPAPSWRNVFRRPDERRQQIDWHWRRG